MAVRLSFFGAASTVTGSCYQIEHDSGRLMIDCGMFQGTKTIRELNYRDFPFQTGKIDTLLLTHAHIDHTGLVPKLVAQGFDGPIYGTPPTVDLLDFMLPDSAHIQEWEVERINRRNRKRGRPLIEAIYGKRDAARALELTRAQEMNEWFEPMRGIRARYWNAGHILGSTSIELEVTDTASERPIKLLFSGDIGPTEKSFHDEPDGPSGVDYVVCESTYGDREREDISLEERRARLKTEVNEAMQAGGNLVIPAFAVERTQELIYSLVSLMQAGDIKDSPIFIDSPLAIKVTAAFAKHKSALHEVDPNMTVFRDPRIRYTQEVDESKAINKIKSGAIIMSASGMCDAGRIKHHLKNNLWRRESTVLFVGYQAPGSLGHLILNGEEVVKIHGEEIKNRARIRRIESFSAHADQGELIAWVKARLPVNNTIFLSHGDPDAMGVFKTKLAEAGCSPKHVMTPELDDAFDLSVSDQPARHSAADEARSRIEPAALQAQEDWHNLYARLSLNLGRRLQAMPEADRTTLLKRINALLDERPQS